MRTLSPRRFFFFFFVQIDIIQTDLRNELILYRRVKNRPFNRSIDNMLAKFFIAFRFDKCINFIAVEKLLNASSINNPEKLNVHVYGIYKK